MSDERSYEWMFVIAELNGPEDERIDALCARSEAVIESHGGLDIVSILGSGRSAQAAAHAALAVMNECGLHPVRTYLDLVTRSDIAERTGRRRQAVDLWVRGQRRHGFPDAVNLVGGGVWLWGDVHRWLGQFQDTDEHELGYPKLRDHNHIDQILARAHSYVVDPAMGVRLGAARAEVFDLAFSKILLVGESKTRHIQHLGHTAVEKGAISWKPGMRGRVGVS